MVAFLRAKMKVNYIFSSTSFSHWEILFPHITMWIPSILIFWFTSLSSFTYVVGCQFCILFIHRIVFKSLTLIFHFCSIWSSFTFVSSIAFAMFQSKNSVLGSSFSANLSSNLAIAFSVDLAFSSFFSFAHHLVLLVQSELYISHLSVIKDFTSLCLEAKNSFFNLL